MLPSSELLCFADAFAETISRVAESTSALLSASVIRVDESSSHAESQPGSPEVCVPNDASTRIDLEWVQWLDEIARPELVRLRRHVELSLRTLEEHDPLETALRELVRVVNELSPTVDLIASPSTTTPVPLRRYLQLALLPSVEHSTNALRLQIEGSLREQSRQIDELEKVLDHYSLAVQRHAAELEDPVEVEALARTGRQRLDVLLDRLQRSRVGQASRAWTAFVQRTGEAFEDACAPFRAHRAEDVIRDLEALERAVKAGTRRPGVLRRTEATARRAYHAVRPLGRRLALELRLLLSERPPEATIRSYPRVLSAGPAQLGVDLPPGYRRLFSAGPIEVADAYVPRRNVESAIRAAIQAWKGGLPQAVLLHGDRGSGKRTLINHVLADVGSASPMRWVRLGRRARDESSTASSLARAMGLRTDVKHLSALSELRNADARKSIIVVENADRLLCPTVDGIARLSTFLQLVGETSSSTFWILLMTTSAVDLAFRRLGLAHRIPTIVGLDPMTPNELQQLLMGRHLLSGFQLDVALPERGLVDHLRHPLSRLRAAKEPLDVFVERLARLTAGNPRQALYLWLSCTGVHPQQEGKIVVESLPTSSTDLLTNVSLPQRLLLALLAQYTVLSEADLRDLLAPSSDGVSGDLLVLRARGFVQASREHESHYTLHPTLAHPVVMELRTFNLL